MAKIAFEYSQMPNIIGKITSLRTQAMVSFQYLTAARIGEVLALKKSDIVDKGTHYEVLLLNEKNRKEKTKIGVLVKGKELWALKPFIDYLNMVETNQVFCLKDDRARLLIRQALGYSSHYLRHSRATHLAQIYKLTAFDLKGVLGHTGMAIAATYVHAELQDRVKKLLETPV